MRGLSRDDRRTVLLVARRDIRERVLSKEFLVSTAVGLAVIGVIVAIARVTADDGGETYEVGVVGEGAAAIGESASELAGAAGGDDAPVVVPQTFRTAAAAEAAVRDGDVDVALVAESAADAQVFVESEVGDELAVLLQTAQHQVATAASLDAAGLSEREQADVLAPPKWSVRALDPVDQEAEDKKALTLIGTFLLYGQLFGYGYWVAAAIVEEKTSRVIELLLAKSRPSALLTGKIVGVGVIGLVTMVAQLGFGLGLATATGAIDLPPGTTVAALQLVAWFVVGFALFSCLFAISGALASRVDELQNSSGPLMLVMIASLMAALTAGNDPSSTISRVMTFFPTTAPLVLPIRQAADEIAPWELAGGLAVVVVTIAVVVPLTARIYAGGALLTRGQLGLRQALSLHR